MYSPLPWIHDFYLEKNKCCVNRILDDDGGRIDNSVFSPEGKNVIPVREVIKQKELA